MTSSSSRDAERRSQNLLRIAACLGVLLIAVVVNSVLHSDGEALNPVAAAAERTQQTPGARLAIESLYTSPAHPQPIVAIGSGAYNARSGRTRVNIDVPASLTPETIVSVGDARTVFVHSAAIAAELPPGRPWLGLQPWLGHSKDSTIAGSGGTKDELEMLRAVGDDVESTGEQTVRGVMTEHYRGSVDLQHLATMLAEEGKSEAAKQYEELAQRMPTPIAIEAWIDAKGILRRERVVVDLPTTAGTAPVKMDMRIEMFDFGISPKIRFPDSSEVFDGTVLGRAESGQLDGATARRLISPDRGTALTQHLFEQRGNEICRRLSDQLGVLTREAAPLLEAAEENGEDPDALKNALQRAGTGYFEPAVRIGEEALSQLGRLKPEPSTSADYATFLDQAALEIELLQALASAFEVGDLKLVGDLDKKLKQASQASDSTAAAVGLPACAGDHSAGSSTSQA